MNWRNLKLVYKFFIAFGIIIFLFLLTGYWAISGIGGIVNNANEVIDGNKLRTELIGKYIDVLHWGEGVNKLLTDNEVSEITVEIDHKQCAFGKWYYGEDRLRAEQLAPQLKTLFDKFEEPHKHLHASVKQIDEMYEQMDWRLTVQLNQAKSDHVEWGDLVFKNIFFGKDKYLNVNRDASKSTLGKVLESDTMAKFLEDHPENSALVDSVRNIHRILFNGIYRVGRLIRENGGRAPAHKYYKSHVKGYIAEVSREIDMLNERASHYYAGADKANEIYQDETMVYLEQMAKLFDETIELSKDYIMTDEVMLDNATVTRRGVLIFIIIATVMGILLAYFITYSLLKPITKSVLFAESVTQGDLTSQLDINQKDEVGQLALALSGMVGKLKDILSSIKYGSNNLNGASNQVSSGAQQISSGATEQAASAEEISSSMEEMTANIQQNALNAQKALGISNTTSTSVGDVAKASEENLKASSDINVKIKVITEIATQTNILALNAAVEAARAGVQGRGFSVIAGEVRKLAEKSQQAAQEIVKLCERGVQLSEDSNQKLMSIIPDINESTMLINEIASASQEQEIGASQINMAIQEFNTVTQRNATYAEEMASSSEELSSQAKELDSLTSFFKVDLVSKKQNKQAVTNKKEEVKENSNQLTNNKLGNNVSIDLDLNDDEYESM